MGTSTAKVNLTDQMRMVMTWMQDSNVESALPYTKQDLIVVMKGLEKRGLVSKIAGGFYKLTTKGWEWQDSAMDVYDPDRKDDIIVWSKADGYIPAPCCGCKCTMCHSNNCCKRSD